VSAIIAMIALRLSSHGSPSSHSRATRESWRLSIISAAFHSRSWSWFRYQVKDRHHWIPEPVTERSVTGSAYVVPISHNA
jgi:hypothetical protein